MKTPAVYIVSNRKNGTQGYLRFGSRIYTKIILLQDFFMTYSWIATSSYNTALQRMSYFVVAKTIERSLILRHWDYLMNLKFNLVHRTQRQLDLKKAHLAMGLFLIRKCQEFKSTHCIISVHPACPAWFDYAHHERGPLVLSLSKDGEAWEEAGTAVSKDVIQ